MSHKIKMFFFLISYMPSNYSFNVEHNFGSSEENTKHNRILGTTSPNELQQQQQNPVLFKEDRSKEDMSSSDTVKSSNLQVFVTLLFLNNYFIS